MKGSIWANFEVFTLTFPCKLIEKSLLYSRGSLTLNLLCFWKQVLDMYFVFMDILFLFDLILKKYILEYIDSGYPRLFCCFDFIHS